MQQNKMLSDLLNFITKNVNFDTYHVNRYF